MQKEQNADAMAQDVVNAWGVNMQAGNGPFLTEEFKVLLDKACSYRDAKELADNHRQFGMLSDRDVAKLEASQREFLAAYFQIHKQSVKRFKVLLTGSRSEVIEVAEPITAEDWLRATRHDGAKFVYLNGTVYPKEELVGAVEEPPRRAAD